MFSYSLLFGVVLWSGLFSGCWSLGSLDSLMIVWCLLVGVVWWLFGVFGIGWVVVWRLFSGCLVDVWYWLLVVVL